MAGTVRCLSLAASVGDLPAGYLRRKDSPVVDPGHLLLRRYRRTSALERIPLPVPAIDRSSASALIGGLAGNGGLRINSLLKFDETSALKRKSLGTLNSKHFVRTGIPPKAGFFMLDTSTQPGELADDRGRNNKRACSFTQMHLKCSSNHFGVSLDSLGMMSFVGGNCCYPFHKGTPRRTSLGTFNLESFLATIAWAFVMPSGALAEQYENNSSYFFNMPLLLLIALIGATVGGLLARQRKAELSRLNDQLRQINAALRRQAKIESYAPNLSYAPIGRLAESDIIVDPKKQELISLLKIGKNYLRHQNPEKAFNEFKSALELAQSIGDPVEEKKAARGLGASLQRQGKFREAIKYHSLVLSISKRTGEDSGNKEAYGAIADCYTELGDLDHAGRFYDQYIARLEKD